MKTESSKPKKTERETLAFEAVLNAHNFLKGIEQGIEQKKSMPWKGKRWW